MEKQVSSSLVCTHVCAHTHTHILCNRWGVRLREVQGHYLRPRANGGLRRFQGHRRGSLEALTCLILTLLCPIVCSTNSCLFWKVCLRCPCLGRCSSPCPEDITPSNSHRLPVTPMLGAVAYIHLLSQEGFRPGSGECCPDVAQIEQGDSKDHLSVGSRADPTGVPPIGPSLKPVSISQVDSGDTNVVERHSIQLGFLKAEVPPTCISVPAHCHCGYWLGVGVGEACVGWGPGSECW